MRMVVNLCSCESPWLDLNNDQSQTFVFDRPSCYLLLSKEKKQTDLKVLEKSLNLSWKKAH